MLGTTVPDALGCQEVDELLNILTFSWCDPAQYSINQLATDVGCHAVSFMAWVIVLALVFSGSIVLSILYFSKMRNN